MTISIGGIVLGALLCIFFYEALIDFFLAPWNKARAVLEANGATTEIVNTGVTQPFTLAVLVCVLGGVSMQSPQAAGPVGLRNEDDFDQDGLVNLADACPRLPVAAKQCTSSDDCDDADCLDGRCNHADRDNDGIGDACDTCPALANPKQNQDGGAQSDDPEVPLARTKVRPP